MVRYQVLRLLALWSLVFWLGGFTFYSAVVIPELHVQLGSPLETGLVTQRVTDVLNLAGLVSLLLAWPLLFAEKALSSARRSGRLCTMTSLAVATACLAAQFLLHRVLDRKLDTGQMEGFYSLHRLYLWVSMAQWVASIVILGALARVWPCAPAEVDVRHSAADHN